MLELESGCVVLLALLLVPAQTHSVLDTPAQEITFFWKHNLNREVGVMMYKSK